MLTRLDQALGRMAEPIVPVLPPTVPQARLTFLEPLMTATGLGIGIARLVGQVCVALEQAGQGARRLDLLFERVDGSFHALRAGTSRPARNPGHLARLLTERLEEVDPEPGVEAMRLVVSLTEPLAYTQSGALTGDAEEDPGLAVLVDRLVNRLGASRVWRTVPVESDVPERTVRRVLPLGQASPPSGWPAALPRPVRLFRPPQPVEAMSLLPDNPPVAFTWRRRRHRISRADGPERIFGEWWHCPAETAAVRDYFRVEDEEGQRFWLFRRGDGTDPASGDLKWFLHGLF
jgi:protein ImuB